MSWNQDIHHDGQKLGVNDVAEVLRCTGVQQQPADGAFHASLQVRCAAAGRDGDAAERNPLQQPQDDSSRQSSQRPPPEREPHGKQQAVQQAPPPAGNGQHGGTLSEAEKQRAMTAALQLWNASGQHVSNGSSAQPPAASASAASTGAEQSKRAALALLQQHSPPSTGRDAPAVGHSDQYGQPSTGTLMRNGATTAGPPALNAPPAPSPAAPNGVQPPVPQPAPSGPLGVAAPRSPSDSNGADASGEGPEYGPRLPTEPPLPRPARRPMLPPLPAPPPPMPADPAAPRPPVLEQ